MYLNDRDELVNTGYVPALKKDEVNDFIWEDLGDSLDIEKYFPNAFDDDGMPYLWFSEDE